MKAKQLATKIVGAVCALALTVSLAACGGGGGGSKTGNKGSAAEKVEFPLKEKVEFTFMVNTLEEVDKDRKASMFRLIDELEEETNVHINWSYLGGGTDGMAKLGTQISGGTYGDVLWGSVLNTADASKYIADGILQDFTDYINENIMPNLTAMIKSNPDIEKAIKAPDGKIYCAPKITEIMGSYLEGPIVINKAWLDKLGLEVPETLDEFTDVLRAFRDKDPNGNGKADEIPFLATTFHAYMNMEQLLGIWGLGTKNDTNDSFVHLDNGKVTFVPVQDGYREYLKYMHLLYSEKLLYQDWANATNDDINSILTSGDCRIGVWTTRDPQASVNSDQYVTIMPPKAEGYEPQWYFHPGYMGAKNIFYVTNKCENLNVLMAWVDKLYDLDNSVKYEHGYPDYGTYEIDENGNYILKELTAEQQVELSTNRPTLSVLNGPRAFTAEEFESGKIMYSQVQKNYQNNYEMYKDILNKEVWPRPYIAAEDTASVSSYATDIQNIVKIYRAACISGEKDVDSTWDSFVKDVEGAGLDEYVKLLQKAYDAVKE